MAHFKLFPVLSLQNSPLTLITGTKLVPIQLVLFFPPGLYKRISYSQMSAKWNRKQVLCAPMIPKQNYTQSVWTGRDVSTRLVPTSANKGNKINWWFHDWPNLFTREPGNSMICTANILLFTRRVIMDFKTSLLCFHSLHDPRLFVLLKVKAWGV